MRAVVFATTPIMGTVWKKNKKGLKLRISKYKTHLPVGSVTDCTVIYRCAEVDQLVKAAGPYQPVVVLQYPKARAPYREASEHCC
ncbi:uncharacterized protein AKAME5_002174800 [Lates japonicus]|uniref:Uncharacterized protein n=1 Tax=Lates japonicus TaxID=270547 RepID=A0AAD3NEY2_LATJO|nr:uncharacterized protein AKAME5_002174800 [Lates japonicus]